MVEACFFEWRKLKYKYFHYMIFIYNNVSLISLNYMKVNTRDQWSEDWCRESRLRCLDIICIKNIKQELFHMKELIQTKLRRIIKFRLKLLDN